MDMLRHVRFAPNFNAKVCHAEQLFYAAHAAGLFSVLSVAQPAAFRCNLSCCRYAGNRYGAFLVSGRVLFADPWPATICGLLQRSARNGCGMSETRGSKVA